MRPLRGSLAARALALQLAGVLAIVGGVGAARYYAIRAELHREVERSAESLAQVLEDLLAVHPELLQRRALDPLVDRFARKLPAVARVSVVDATGAILVDSRHAEAPPTDQEALLPLLTEAGEQRSSFEVAGDRYLRVSRSLRGRYDPVLRSDIVGAVTLDMRLALTDAAVTRDLVSEMTLVLALCIPIGSLLYLRTRRTLVRPLDQLAAAGAQFTRGEVPAPLTFSGRDELAGGFLHCFKGRIIRIKLLISRNFHLELNPEVKLF